MAQVSPSLVRAVTDKVGIACLIAALLLLACGATGQVPGFAPIKEPIFQWLLIVLGALLLVPSVALLVMELRAKPASPSSSPSVVPDPEKLGFAITEPKIDAPQRETINFAGTLKRRPPKGFEIWLILMEGQPGSAINYWPYRPLHISSPRKKQVRWSVTYVAKPKKPSERRRLHFYLVGPDGQKLIRLYSKLNSHFEKPDGAWDGIVDFTSDITPIGDPIAVTVTREATGDASQAPTSPSSASGPRTTP
ncbi:MAG: hypothetical protein ACLQJR_01395 [Stellaceae bacterium]